MLDMKEKIVYEHTVNNIILYKILDKVHDKNIDFDVISLDESHCQVIIPLSIISEKPLEIKKRFLFFTYGLYVEYKACLIIDGVKSLRFMDPDKIRICMINSIIIEAHYFKVSGCTNNYIEGEGKNIKLSLEVSGESIEKYWRFIGFGKSMG